MLDVIENEKLIQHADYIGNILLEGARQLAEKYEVNCWTDVWSSDDSSVIYNRSLETCGAGDSSLVSTW